MDSTSESVDRILQSLAERAKELNCLYRIDEILDERDLDEASVFQQIVETIPPGWQFPEVCNARLDIDGICATTPGFVDGRSSLSAAVEIEGKRVGTLTVSYSDERPEFDEGPFLKEERRLIDAIAQRLGTYIMQARLRHAHARIEDVLHLPEEGRASWEVLLDFLRHIDTDLLIRVTRRMINHLCWNGVNDASALLEAGGAALAGPAEDGIDENRPQRKQEVPPDELTRQAFELAAQNLLESEIVDCIRTWINEEKSLLLTKILENPDRGLAETIEALKRFRASGVAERDLPTAVRTNLRVGLVRRFFVDQNDYISVAKEHISIEDLHEVVERLVLPSGSHGKIGGKGAGLFLATQILRKRADDDLLRQLRVPKTWYVASDGLLSFIHYNNLEEVYNRKYMELERVRQDYPHIIQVFKNSPFPPEMVTGLAAALDEFGDRPIIVRSSSLLEDRFGASFAGKYKSLFLANQGSKAQRLAALQDAIAEIYASVFGPDPIEYRAERGLLHFDEGMGILIQEVVGKRVGRYFSPSFAGVAFSSNEFRWSPRIRREDGLLRVVPGLGTRAVDRLSDDYPILLAPGQPALPVNASPDEIIRYSPRRADVIDLGSNDFVTVSMESLLRAEGDRYPSARRLVSIVEHDLVRSPSGLEPDWQTDDFVVTLAGVLARTPFVGQMHSILTTLRNEMGTEVDLEFAHDGENLYLLQCRSQSSSHENKPAAIPRDIPREHLLFSANRHISNGHIPDLTHVVYVDPEGYASLSEYRDLKEVALAIGRVNSLLPKRQFALLGPGRWGSRGDIKLGVSVTYSDISNCALLVEIARKAGSYAPEPSFGTHFFQDMVESGIRYLALYPDEPENVFRKSLLHGAQNMLPDLLPDQSHLADVLRVIDIERETKGRVLRVLMNANLQEAVGLLTRPSNDAVADERIAWVDEGTPGEHWRWRLRMAEQIAARLDAEAYGVKNLYIIGSVKNATAGPGSDIDLLIHDDGDECRRARFRLWLDGWSQTLAEVNFLRTGYESEGLLDLHFVTDEDIAAQTSFAAKINAITDAARALKLGRRGRS